MSFPRALLIATLLAAPAGAQVSKCAGRDPWRNPATGETGACINPTGTWQWHCPWESDGLVSGYGCNLMPYDCDDQTNIQALIAWYEANLPPNGTPPEWGVERTEYTLRCIKYQCVNDSPPPGPCPACNGAKFIVPSAYNVSIGDGKLPASSVASLSLTWNDCGDQSYHAHVTGVTPSSMVLGQSTHVVGTGPFDEAVGAGSFSIQLKIGVLPPQTFSGDICKASTFPLPLGIGSIAWDGIACPIVGGATSIATTIKLSRMIPPALLKAALKITATASNGDRLFCLDISVAPEGRRLASVRDKVLV